MNRVQIELEGTFEHECFVVGAVAQAQRENLNLLAEVEVKKKKSFEHECLINE